MTKALGGVGRGVVIFVMARRSTTHNSGSYRSLIVGDSLMNYEDQREMKGAYISVAI
jgi:hypothetical protein